MNELYSNAFNFSSSLSTGVDPRTGQYSASLKLITLTPFNMEGPSYPIRLSFSLFNSLNNGFGTGWSLSSARFNVQDRLFTKNSGETFKSETVAPGNKVILKDKKLNSFKFFSQSNDLFQVYNKEGIIETLQRVSLSSPLALTTAVTFENGETFDFAYGVTISGTPCLTEIIHRQTNTVVLRLTYFGQTCDQLQYPDDDGGMLRILFDYRNNLLSGISLPFSLVRPSAGYVFNYQTLQNTYQAINRYRAPTGYVEQIQYNATGMRITNTSTIPCVTALHAFPGNGQPAILKNFQYSSPFNFTGFFSGRNHIDKDQDNLYLVTGTYNYSSTETLVENGNIISTTERTFNRFHLLIQENKIEGGKRLSRNFSYNETPGFNYYEQPANLQLYSRLVTIYTDLASGTTRQEQELYQTDHAGNSLRITHVDGTQEINEYYPAEGEVNNCPADPFGFSRFVKLTIKKAAYGNAPDKITRHFWQSMPAFNGSVLNSYICLVQEDVSGGLTRRYNYINTPSQRQHSLLLQINSVMNNLETSSSFDYQFTAASVIRKETLLGHDGGRKQIANTLALLSKRKLKTTDENNTSIEYRYTPEGQLSEEISSAGTGQEVRRRYDWQYPAATQDNFWPSMTESTPEGVSRLVRFDGMARVCSIQEQDDDAPLTSGNYVGTYRETFSRKFNVQGLVVSETDTDWLWDLTASTPRRLTQPLRQVKNHIYDGWGGLIKTLYDDGRIEEESYDPVSMISRQGQQGLGIVITQKNLFGQPETISLLKTDQTVYASTSLEYDGFGRKIAETNSQGDTTYYEWDIFDRLIRTLQPDGTRLDSAYASFSADDLTATVTVNDTRLAEAIYDGLGRVVRETVGGRIVQYSYNQGESFPQGIITPANSSQSRNYEYPLGGVISQIQTPHLSQNFSYHPGTGKIQRASEGSVSNQLEYFPSGRVKHEQLTLGQQPETSCEYKYSMSGALQYFRDAMGNEHLYYYDNYGRLKNSSQGSQSATYTYDVFGRLNEVQVEGENGGLNTTISYDEFSREIRRVFRSQASTEILTQTFTSEGKLNSRLLIRDSLVLNNEKFEYDSNGRLHIYHCAGVESPGDSSGGILSGQRYYYDQWGNICRMENQYLNGTETIDYQFSPLDPTQLISVSDRSGTCYLQYDDNGNLIRDEKAQSLSYDSKNRLTEVRNQNNQLVCRYQYDARDRLVAQELPNGKINRFHYGNQHLSNVETDDEKLTWLDDSTHKRLGHTSEKGGNKQYHQYGLLSNGTPCMTQTSETVSYLNYTPYGFRSLFSNSPGMAGAQIDSVTGWYFLGDGYRVFNPVLMRFHSPDSWSPFGKGGINPYIYCLGDPVNRSDLSGHLSTSSIIGITLASVGILLAILSFGAAIPAVAASSSLLASMAVSSKVAAVSVAIGAASDVLAIASLALSESDPETSSIIGWVSTLLTGVSLGAGVYPAATSFRAKKSLSQATATAPRNTNVNLNGFTSLTGELTAIDIVIAGTGLFTGIAGMATGIAAGLVEDEDTANILGGISLLSRGIGFMTTPASIWRGWKYQQSYDVTPHQITDNLRLEHSKGRPSFDYIHSVLDTRL